MIAAVIRIVIGFAVPAYFWILLAAFFSRSFVCDSAAMRWRARRIISINWLRLGLKKSTR